MNMENAKNFLKELSALEEKYGIHISSSYEEEIDYTYEEESYVSGVHSYLVLVDQEGNDVPLNDILNDYFTCHHCGAELNGDHPFCNSDCEKKYKGLK